MPTWTFRCPHCGAHQDGSFINFQQMDDCGLWCQCDPYTTTRMERQPSAPSLSFKGPGWTPKHFGGK